MTGGCMDRPLAALAIAGLALVIGLSGSVRAQQENNAAALKEAGTLAKKAAVLYDAGKYAEAAPLYLQSLSIREKVLGPEHADVAMTLNSLALVYQMQSRSAKAEPLFKRSVAVYEKV